MIAVYTQPNTSARRDLHCYFWDCSFGTKTWDIMAYFSSPIYGSILEISIAGVAVNATPAILEKAVRHEIFFSGRQVKGLKKIGTIQHLKTKSGWVYLLRKARDNNQFIHGEKYSCGGEQFLVWRKWAPTLGPSNSTAKPRIFKTRGLLNLQIPHKMIVSRNGQSISHEKKQCDTWNCLLTNLITEHFKRTECLSGSEITRLGIVLANKEIYGRQDFHLMLAAESQFKVVFFTMHAFSQCGPLWENTEHAFPSLLQRLFCPWCCMQENMGMVKCKLDKHRDYWGSSMVILCWEPGQQDKRKMAISSWTQLKVDKVWWDVKAEFKRPKQNGQLSKADQFASTLNTSC